MRPIGDTNDSSANAPGARCPRRVIRGLPCPGRLLPSSGAPRAGDDAPRLRCNGPDAHEVETRDVAPPRDATSR
jgi:hypothetical protein